MDNSGFVTPLFGRLTRGQLCNNKPLYQPINDCVELTKWPEIWPLPLIVLGIF